MSFPKLGPVSKWILLGLAIMSLANAILINWMQHLELMYWFKGSVSGILQGQVWRLVTASLLSPPNDVISHTLYPLFILFWFMPLQESVWGSKRTLLFALGAGVFANVVNVALSFVPVRNPVFRVDEFMGFGAISMAFAVAWAVSNLHNQLRLFFFPITGNVLRWILLAIAVLLVVYHDPSMGGFFAPLAGWCFGAALGGSPSFFRKIFLKGKLAQLERQAEKSKRRGGPPLRVVYGGLLDEIENKPRDKDSLN